jgi:hypothetical protein
MEFRLLTQQTVSHVNLVLLPLGGGRGRTSSHARRRLRDIHGIPTFLAPYTVYLPYVRKLPYIGVSKAVSSCACEHPHVERTHEAHTRPVYFIQLLKRRQQVNYCDR